jgi:hypothetical protein
VLAELFPREIICEEVPVTGERFVLDFFVPSLRMVVECHGRQHYEHVPPTRTVRRLSVIEEPSRQFATDRLGVKSQEDILQRIKTPGAMARRKRIGLRSSRADVF